MRTLVWTGLLLVLTVVCSVTVLAHMVGMPIGSGLLGSIAMLSVLVGWLGLALMVRSDTRLAPLRVRA
jgi:hypothetical protein